jgi:hypothetical protein
MRVAIFFRKEERVTFVDFVLSNFFGIEFQRCACSSYINLFFILLVRGWGKQRLLEMFPIKFVHVVCHLTFICEKTY